MKWTFVLLLAAQLVVQTVALTALLNRGGSGENQTTFLASLLRAFGISLGSVVLELWLHHTMGVGVVVLVLAIPVVVLLRHDWATMRFACVVTLGISLAVLLLSADFGGWFLARLQRGEKETANMTSVFSYAQVAGKLDFAGARPAVQPPEAPHAPGPTGSATVATATNAVFASTDLSPPSLAPSGAGNDAPPALPDWSAARREIRLGGRIKQADGRVLALVNDELWATNEVIEVRHGTYLYRWRVDINLQGVVSLEKLDARIVENAERE